MAVPPATAKASEMSVNCSSCKTEINRSDKDFTACLDNRTPYYLCGECVDALESIVAKARRSQRRPFKTSTAPLLSLLWSIADDDDLVCSSCFSSLECDDVVLKIGLGDVCVATICTSCSDLTNHAPIISPTTGNC